MDSITLWGPVRLLPNQSRAWSKARGEQLKQLFSDSRWQALFQRYLKDEELGDVPEDAYRAMLETALVTGDPKSWEGGPITVQVGDRLSVKVGHLMLIDLVDGQVSQLKLFN